MGTNENIKNINNNQNIEKLKSCQSIENAIENVNNVQIKNNFNSNNAQENVEKIEPNFQLIDNTKEQNEIKQFNMQETQRIDFLSELLKDSENAKEEIAGKLQKQSLQVENIKLENVEVQKSQTELENVQELNTQDVNTQSENVSVESSVVQNIESIESKQENLQTAQEKVINIKDPNDIVSTKTQQINQIEETEKKQKQHVQDKKDYRLERMLFDRINKMQGKIKESLELIKKFERINAKEENLPNIVTTLHDKLTQEVIKQFRTVGIEFNMKSYLVQSIVSDLLSKFEEGITEFKDCSENLNFVREVQEDFESKVELAPTSRVKNIFARLRGIFKPERKQERLEQLERERQEKKLEEANIHLIKYKFINSELEKYTIRKNIVNSLTREILYGQGSGLTLTVTEFINEKIITEMKMLGLDGLLPELKNNLFAEYKEKFNNIQNEEFFNLSIGEVKKNIKFSTVGYLRSKVCTVASGNSEEAEKLVV